MMHDAALAPDARLFGLVCEVCLGCEPCQSEPTTHTPGFARAHRGAPCMVVWWQLIF